MFKMLHSAKIERAKFDVILNHLIAISQAVTRKDQP
jgi:hypothetical protein